jgi:hypothetical protein
MDIKKAKQFLSLPTNSEEWDGTAWRMLRERSTFLNVDWGQESEEIIDNWNNLASDHFVEITPEDTQTAAGFTDRLKYKGQTLTVPYRASPEDCFRLVLSLNHLVRSRIGIRLSKESTGNSDWSFLPLPHESWSKLEEEFGKEFVDCRFIQLPDSWEELEIALSGR